MEITESDTIEEALNKANSQTFSAVLAAGNSDPSAARDFMKQLKDSLYNARTPFIVLCEEDCGKTSRTKHMDWFEHVVHLRLRPADLIKKIDEVCNPRQMRRDERFYLPNTTISVTGDDFQIEARLINISRGGVLVEMSTNAPAMLMKNDIRLNLYVQTPSQSFDIRNLRSKLLRLYVATWHEDNTPAAMRVTFLFADLEPQTRSLLQALLEQARHDQQLGEQMECTK